MVSTPVNSNPVILNPCPVNNNGKNTAAAGGIKYGKVSDNLSDSY